ncbi:hypothetical protein PILCRDRAFT_639245 [Piloderma croceum F 1598]|uniref:Uncharacterized protein n=1 Tax=Piloderma croceum (strain F 1598) TaxID=765440 RepID=A0A0C3ARX6_PILCF|nr:hypothetical protein PILCRDRAFT_639245 [Piloderma croceum F 1598]
MDSGVFRETRKKYRVAVLLCQPKDLFQKALRVSYIQVLVRNYAFKLRDSSDTQIKVGRMLGPCGRTLDIQWLNRRRVIWGCYPSSWEFNRSQIKFSMNLPPQAFSASVRVILYLSSIWLVHWLYLLTHTASPLTIWFWG